jgi:hypothetical protein
MALDRDVWSSSCFYCFTSWKEVNLTISVRVCEVTKIGQDIRVSNRRKNKALLRIKVNSDIRLNVKGRTDTLDHFDLG